MGLNHSPKIITDGLLFAYDIGNTEKSGKGAPTENLIAISGSDAGILRSGVGYSYYGQNISSAVQSRWSAGNNQLTLSFEGRRDYSIGGTGSGNDGFPQAYVYFSDWSWAVAVGVVTYSWSRGSVTFTMPDPTGKAVMFDIYHMNAGNPGLSYSRNHQVEFSTYATPFVNGTRTNTQAVLDLTGVSTITAINMAYASNGAITFNGSTSGMTVSTSLFNRVNGSQMTVACWIKPSRLSGVYQMLVDNRSDNQYNWMLYQHTNDGSIQLHGLNQNKSTYIPTVGTWIYVVNTVDPAGNSILYINGVVQQTVTGFTYNLSSPSLLCIGRFGASGYEPYQGSIEAVQLYNRVLSQDEIQRNFNALRGRYGI